MNYGFPKITHIDDVLPAIKDSPEFIVVDKDDYTVINYVVMNENTFPSVTGENLCPGCYEYKMERNNCGSQRCPEFIDASAIRRECRGLIFGKDGKLINRRFHKFFNVNERDETRHEAIDWSKPHHILEKMDGSMVSPCRVGEHIRWMTKMGITDVSMEAEVFVATRPDYTLFANRMLQKNWTPIFEWCSNKNRIVLDYSWDQLVLLAVRDNTYGTYIPHYKLAGMTHAFDIPVVKAWSNEQIEKMGTLIGVIRQQEDTEGVVVRFDDGHMVKVKSDWYVRIHKIKALLGNERDVVSMILNNQLDDIIPVLPKEEIEKIELFKHNLYFHLKDLAFVLFDNVSYSRKRFDRKTFAIQESHNYDPLWRGLIFKFWDNEVTTQLTYQAIVDIVLKHCGSNQSYQKIKQEFLNGVDYA